MKESGNIWYEVNDHGGSLSQAEKLFPDAPRPFLDLSTGINPHSYPLPDFSESVFTRLPDEARLHDLRTLAAQVYGAPSPAHVAAAPGTQILLPLVASLAPQGRAAILSPTYAEHRRAAAIAGHEAIETTDIADLSAADLAIVVNPNNPDGRICKRAELLALAERLKTRGGYLLIDEAFMDVGPEGESLARDAGIGNVIILRSFGKFFGLAGIRLGFAIGARDLMQNLHARLGPWAVSGPAIEIGIAALGDRGWQDSMRRKINEKAARLDRLLQQYGLTVTGGTSLFRFIRANEAPEIFQTLGRAGIFVRAFDNDPRALRFGLPASAEDFARLDTALLSWRCNRNPAR
jgi:cobalamin biosynthetic protein CobC